MYVNGIFCVLQKSNDRAYVTTGAGTLANNFARIMSIVNMVGRLLTVG